MDYFIYYFFFFFTLLAAETTDHYEINANKVEKTKSSKIDEEKAKDSSDDSGTDLATKLKIKKLTSRPKSRAGKVPKDSSDSEEDVKEKPRKGKYHFAISVNYMLLMPFFFFMYSKFLYTLYQILNSILVSLCNSHENF